MKIEKNLTEGGVSRNLILFAVPFLISNLVQSMYSMADMLIVGNFCGAESMSGVNIGGQLTFILTNLVIGLCVGATVLIGQFLGSGERDALQRVVSTIITLLIGIALVLTPLVLVFRGALLRLIQTPPESFAESSAYFTVTATGIIFIFGYNAFSAILRGMGNSKHPFIFVLVACITNIVLDLLFVGVFGWAAFGAALATVISQALSMFLCVAYMIKNKFLFDFKPKSYKIHKTELKLIFRIGLPTCVQNGIVSFSFLFITTIINIIGGVTASAAVGAVGRFNGFVFMPINAFAASVSTMSAQNIGAGRLDRAVKCCKLGTLFSVCVGFTFFALAQIFPAQIMRLFGDDPRMIADGVNYLRSFSYDFLLIPFIFNINSLFIGGGHTVLSLINSMISSVLLRVPASFLLGYVMELGLSGAGMAAPIASTGSLILIIVYLFSGKWKVNKVRRTTEAPVLEV